MTFFYGGCGWVFSIALLARMAIASGEKVILWNSGTCPYAQRACIALSEKGIDFDHNIVDLKNKGTDFEAAYRRANPNPLCSSKVPVLVVERDDDGKTEVYTESKIVLETIEELWPQPPLLPVGSEGRAKARTFGDAVYDVAFGGDRSAHRVAMRKLDGDWDEDKERRNLCESLAALDVSLRGFHSDGPFVLGEHFSLAECTTAPFVQRADVVFSHFCGMDVTDICKSEGYTRAGAWWKAVLERGSVCSSGGSREHIIAGAERLFGMIRSRSHR